jgi:hypothetical protein
MTAQHPVETTNLDIYGNPELPWSGARDAIAAVYSPKPHSDAYIAATLGTIRPDGRPHAAPVGALWVDDTLYFVSGPTTQKTKNLAHDPNCTFSLHGEGMDVVLEGVATRVTDTETLEHLAGQYRNSWPVEVEGDAFTAPYSAPSAGPPPWYLYRLTAHQAVGVGTVHDVSGATRWTFEEEERR